MCGSEKKTFQKSWIGPRLSSLLFQDACKHASLMPQSHTHLRTLRMIRKAHPNRSVHSVTTRNYTYLIRRVPYSSYLIRKTHSIRAQIFKNIKKSSADEQNAIIRNSRHSCVSIRILSVSHP